MNIKTILKSSVAASALFALAAPVSTTAMAAELVMSGHVSRVIMHGDAGTDSQTFFQGPGGGGGATAGSRSRRRGRYGGARDSQGPAGPARHAG